MSAAHSQKPGGILPTTAPSRTQTYRVEIGFYPDQDLTIERWYSETETLRADPWGNLATAGFVYTPCAVIERKTSTGETLRLALWENGALVTKKEYPVAPETSKVRVGLPLDIRHG
jgi:hypothetical protein